MDKAGCVKGAHRLSRPHIIHRRAQTKQAASNTATSADKAGAYNTQMSADEAGFIIQVSADETGGM